MYDKYMIKKRNAYLVYLKFTNANSSFYMTYICINYILFVQIICSDSLLLERFSDF